MKVLIIDNHTDQTQRTKNFFGFNDEETDLAHTRDEAIKNIIEYQYDVIFLDLMLIGGGDWTAATYILEQVFQTENRHGVVFLITNYADGINDDERLKQQLDKFPIILITTPLLGEIGEVIPREYNEIKKIIDIIDKTIKRNSNRPFSKNHAIKPFFIVCKSIFVIFIFISSIKYLPSILDLPRDTNGLIVFSIPPIITLIACFFNELQIIINLVKNPK
ncbi:MAG: response regulator [Methylococcales bacterium]|nr:response regulator [Methylococcales bacterium]